MFWLFSLQSVRKTILCVFLLGFLDVAMVLLFLLVDPVSTTDLALEEKQVAAVRLLQLSSNLAVCPSGM